MATYIRGGSSNFSSIITNAPTLASVQVDSIGDTIFVAYNYRDQPDTALVSPPTWNGETFTELANFGDIPADEQHVVQLFYLTTASTGTFSIVASNAESVVHSAVWGVYSGVTSVAPIETEEQWFASGYTNPSLTVAGTGTVLNVFTPQNWADGFSDVSATTWSAANGQTVRQSVQNTNIEGGWAILADIDSSGSQTVGWTPSANQPAYMHIAVLIGGSSTTIAQADTTPEDGVQQTVTCTGMTGPITAATLGGYDIFSLLSGTDPASPITYTLDISSLAEGTNASLPRLGASLDLVFTTATDGAVTQSGIVIQPKTGWALVELEDTINKDANGLIATIEADTGLTVTNADALYYETANNASITVNGVYTSDLTTSGQSTKIILQDGGTSPATSYSDGFYPYGEASGGGTSKQTLNISNLRIGL